MSDPGRGPFNGTAFGNVSIFVLLQDVISVTSKQQIARGKFLDLKLSKFLADILVFKIYAVLAQYGNHSDQVSLHLYAYG